MTVFKTFIQILKKNKGIVILYTVLLLVFGSLNMQNNQSSIIFEAYEPDIFIVNEDEEVGVTKDLIKYIKDHSKTPEIKNNEDAINDALFYEDVSLVVYIPKDYNKDFMDGKNPQITIKKSQTYYSSLAEMIVQRYVKVATIYQKSIKDESLLIEKINETLGQNVETNITTQIDTGSLKRAAFYYDFASYSFIACLIYVICLIFTTFNQVNVRKRTIISSYNYKKYNRALLLSNCLYSLVLWLFYVIMSFIIVGKAMVTINGTILIANSLVFVICSTCMSFFIGNLVKDKNAITGIVNVVAIGSSFLCGAFVPAQWLPDFVKTIAHVLPAYYYINTNDRVALMEEFTWETLTPVLINTGILIGFSILFIILANIVSKKKRKIG